HSYRHCGRNRHRRPPASAPTANALAVVLFRRNDLPVNRPDNGLLSGTSDNDAWRAPGNGRAAVCDSGALSGISAGEERKPDASPRRRSNGGQAPGNPNRTASLRQSEHVPPQAAGHLVTKLAVLSAGPRPRTDGNTNKYPGELRLAWPRGDRQVMTLRDS